MSHEILPFTFNVHTVRSFLIDGEPWFVLADVCAVLEIANSRNVSARLDDDEKDVCPVDTPGGTQFQTIINESGLYSVILKSDKPQAKAFKKWVTSEVLPTIRKTGKYEVASSLPQSFAEALQLAADIEKERERLAIENAAQGAKILADAPKVEGYTDVMDSRGLLSVQEVAAMLHIGPNKFFEMLRRDQYLMDRKNVGKDRHNLPYAHHLQSGLFETKAKAWESGDTEGISTRVWVTGKGLDILRRRYLHQAAA